MGGTVNIPFYGSRYTGFSVFLQLQEASLLFPEFIAYGAVFHPENLRGFREGKRLAVLLQCQPDILIFRKCKLIKAQLMADLGKLILCLLIIGQLQITVILGFARKLQGNVGEAVRGPPPDPLSYLLPGGFPPL